MIQIQISYALHEGDNFRDREIEYMIRPHCQDLELQGSGFGFGKRDLEYWATAIDPNISISYALEPLDLPDLDVLIDYDYQEDEDEED